MAIQTQINGLDLGTLQSVLASWQADPAKRQTNWRTRIEWRNGFSNTFQSRSHAPISVDEPTSLGGTDVAPNPAEVLLGALGTCVSIGYALNATARGIDLRSLTLDLEGDIDLTVFGGLAEAGNPGYSNIRLRVNVDSDADANALQALHEHVLRTSPILSTVARPVNVTSELRISTPATV
ncbi:MAG: OsmC family protein [Chloroflexota bacterium]|nr:OsmC family protein [Chloroflexota bacterium]